MMRTRFFRLLLLAAVALPGLAHGQEVVLTVQPRRGWLGVTIDFTQVGVGDRARAAAVVEAVTSESPAEAAGIRVGDTITHIDGQAVSQGTLDALRLDLDPGDLVRLTVRREGRSRELLVEAAPWPDDERIWILPNEEARIPNLGEMVIRLDSVRGAILQNLDTMALSFRHVGRDSLGNWSMEVFRSRPPTPNATYTWEFRYPNTPFDSLQISSNFFLPGPEAALGFETFLVKTPRTDSVRARMDQASRSLTEVRRRELARISELQAGGRHVSEEILRSDERIRELRTREEALVAELESLRNRLRALSEEEMKRQWAESQMQTQEAFEKARAQVERSRSQGTQLQEQQLRQLRQLEEEIYTPQRIIALGQTFILGAQLQALNPELAEYFPVDKGVLVTQVVEGTPADDAGFRGGDIIVRVGGDPVASLDDLRFFVGYFQGPLRVQVVRKGEPVELVIRR